MEPFSALHYAFQNIFIDHFAAPKMLRHIGCFRNSNDISIIAVVVFFLILWCHVIVRVPVSVQISLLLFPVISAVTS